MTGVYYVATVVKRGVERTPTKGQRTKLTLEKKILPPLLDGFELATFRSRVRTLTNTLSGLFVLSISMQQMNFFFN